MTMNTGDEFSLVEFPLVQKLETLGWATLDGDPEVPEFTERASFREAILTKRLARALRRIRTATTMRGAGSSGTPRARARASQ
jgi:hypothetical protein